MKFDPREFELLTRPPPKAPPRTTQWTPTGVRWVRLVETIAYACLAGYFAAGLMGILLA